MARKSYIQIDGVLYEKGAEPASYEKQAPRVFGDLPDFVSPIDGTIVRGRAGMREHCKRHDVVPTADLAGLPSRMPEQRLPTAERREDIKRTMQKLGYF